MITGMYKWITSCLILFTSCSGSLTGDEDNMNPEEKGEPIRISFDMFQASLTKATANTDYDDMEEGKTFCIYAYNSVQNGTPDFSKPLASAVYTVKKEGTSMVGSGDLRLYRGTYYMYLVSYNQESEIPALKDGTGQIEVVNGKDFMYTTLENIVVQPENPGGSSMTVKLPSPFKRLGSQVVVRACAKNSTQPVDVTTLEVLEISVGGLPASLTYKFGQTTWDSCDKYETSYTYPGNVFSRTNNSGQPSNSVYDFWSSTPTVLLPVNGSEKLTFGVKLRITYESGTKEVTQVYPASIQKVLLPGMTYVFDFTLLFYGEIVPTDLTLAVREYNTIPLESDGLGK